MPEKNRTISRRDFLNTAGAVSLVSSLVPIRASAETSARASTINPEKKDVPTRPYIKTDLDNPILSLRIVIGISEKLMFSQALRMGVSYWDTADSYGLGKNDKSIGKYFSSFPDERKNIFLVKI